MPNEKQKEYISNLVNDIIDNQQEAVGRIIQKENVGEQNKKNYLKAAILDAVESLEGYNSTYGLNPDQKDVPYLLVELGLVDEKSKLLTEKGIQLKEDYQVLQTGKYEIIKERAILNGSYKAPKVLTEKDISESVIIDLGYNS